MADEDEIEGPTPADINKLRQSCREEWVDQAMPMSEWYPLRGGPADGQSAPRKPGDKEWTGPWVNDEGDVVRVTYEWVSEPDESWYGEFAGGESVRDQANAIVTEFFAKEADAIPVDIESLSTKDALEFLRDDNARRIEEIKTATDGKSDLSHAFDMVYVKIFVNRILLFMSTKIHEEASLEYEDERSRLLDEVEDQIQEFERERESALARAQLQANAAPYMAHPQHQGRVTLPPRRVRRGNR